MSKKKTKKFFNTWSRKLHRWGSIVIAVPLLIVIGSGVVLQLKKDVAWIQPPTQRGEGPPMLLSFEEILEVAKTEPRAAIGSWDDVDRLDVRPSRGVVKVRAENRWEVQIDTATGAILSSTYRRSDLIEHIHDGSFFHDKAKLWIFLPSGVILLALWITGMYLWALPIVMKRKGKAKRQHAKSTAARGEASTTRDLP